MQCMLGACVRYWPYGILVPTISYPESSGFGQRVGARRDSGEFEKIYVAALFQLRNGLNCFTAEILRS